MKEFEGTKGEWKISREHSYETTISSGIIRVAQSKHYNEGDNDWTKNDPKLKEGKANAKLIAAAPELLAACQNALKDVQKLNKQLIEQGHHGYILMENELNNAINKALN